nr:chondroitin sulfate proteoglycan 4 [Hymenolepis microstoma]
MFKHTNKSLTRPAIAITPIGYVPLTSEVLLPRENSTINPLHIASYVFRIVDINIGIIQYTITTNEGQESWSRVQEFTGKDVLEKKIRYVANIMQPENYQTKLSDNILIQVTHPTNSNEQAILEIPVNFSRIELQLTRNELLTIFQISKISAFAVAHENCITRWNLEAQSIPMDSNMNVCFNITEMPKHGHIYLHKDNNDKIYLGVGSIFRQSDVNEGELFYKFRRVIDSWSSATSGAENGLIYIKDEFKFRIHVHSYRPSTEHIFNINILESTAEPSFDYPMSNHPLEFRKQIGVTQKGGVLIIQPPLIEVKKSICMKLPNMVYNADVNPEDVTVRVVGQPTSGCILLDNQSTDKFDYSAVLRYRVVYWQCKPLQDRTFGVSDLDEIQEATLVNYTLSVENFDTLTMEVVLPENQGSKGIDRVNVKVKLIMNDLTSVNGIRMHPTINAALIRIDSNPLSAILANPNPSKFFNVRISRNPSQLRDILPRHSIDTAQKTFFKVLKVPCQIEVVMFISGLSVNNVLTFTSDDLLEGRIYVIPSANCNNETAGSELHLLQQITNNRGHTHQQPFTIRINVSPRSHYLSFRNLTIGVGERISLKESKLHISQVDEGGKSSSILDCRCFYAENKTHSGGEAAWINEIFVVEEQPTCGKLISKRLNRTVRMFSKKNLMENDIFFEHNGKETCNFASITISGIIRGDVETRVPRQKMTFFLLVRGVPVYLIRNMPAQIWWSSIVEISPSNLASQTAATYEDLEMNGYARIEYRIRGLKSGLVSSSPSEVSLVSTFTNEDIQQHRVIFQHDGYARIEYRIRGLKSGLVSSSPSEVSLVSTFTNEDIQQHRVIFQHDGEF